MSPVVALGMHEDSDDTAIETFVDLLTLNQEYRKLKIPTGAKPFELTRISTLLPEKFFPNRQLRKLLTLAPLEEDFQWINQEKILFTYSRYKNYAFFGTAFLQDFLMLAADRKLANTAFDTEFARFIDRAAVRFPEGVLRGLVNMNYPSQTFLPFSFCADFNLVNREKHFDFNGAFLVKQPAKLRTGFGPLYTHPEQLEKIVLPQINIVKDAVELYINMNNTVPESLDALRGDYLGDVLFSHIQGVFAYKKVDDRNYLLGVLGVHREIRLVFVSQFDKLYHLEHMLPDEKQYLLNYFNRY